MLDLPHKLKTEVFNIHTLIKEAIRKATVLHERPPVMANESDDQLVAAIDSLKIALGVYEDFMGDFKKSYVEIDSEIILEEIRKQKEREEKERQ